MPKLSHEVLPGTPSSKSSAPEAAYNMINSIIGAGIVGLPYAMQQAGFVWGILLLGGVAGMTAYSTTLIVRLGIEHGADTYDDLARIAFGRTGFRVLLVLQFLFAFGAMCAYFVILGDTIPTVLSHYYGDRPDNWHGKLLTDRHSMTTLLAVFIILPICTLRNFSALSKTSALSLAAVCFFVVSVIYKFATDDSLGHVPSDTTSAYWNMHADIFPAIGTISFAFVCHHQSFLVYNSLQDQSLETFTSVANWSVGLSAVASSVMAIIGYLSFYGATDSDIFSNYSEGDGLIDAARLMLALTMLFTYPMEFQVAKISIESLLDHDAAAAEDGDNYAPLAGGAHSPPPGAPPVAFETRAELVRHWVLILLLWGMSLGVAVVATTLNQVLSLTGGVCAVTIGFVMPASCFLKLGLEDAGPMERLACLVILWFGIISFFMATGYSLYDLGSD